ncbi:DUF2332 domain-containing protein [Streptomyces sp900116325]|uniref:DUF2332 domain-containing protein n=1 Tax=Streptomyces sp. 900116325 TaxID=3154295 RepID=UPI0033D63A93
MPRAHVAAMIEHQAESCAKLNSPLYAALLRQVAQDVRAGGPCADAVAGYETAPGPDAIALRLLGGVHALALTGQAPDLAVHYPSTGGTFDPDQPHAGWPAFRATVAAEMTWVRDWMSRPPQTNEVGRANLLIAGLLQAAQSTPLPIRLFELGSSAGLNLRADRFRYTSDGFAWGPRESSVRMENAWRGAPPEWLRKAAAAHRALTITERRGCDLSPIDPLSRAGALALRAYVWPDQTARAARLDGALMEAARVQAEVERIGAAEFLAGIRLEPGALTVVWHSVMRQYVPAMEWAEVERELDRLAAASTPEAAFAHVSFEPRRVGEQHHFQLAVRLGSSAETVLAEAYPHGLPAYDPSGPGPRS